VPIPCCLTWLASNLKFSCPSLPSTRNILFLKGFFKLSMALHRVKVNDLYNSSEPGKGTNVMQKVSDLSRRFTHILHLLVFLSSHDLPDPPFVLFK
jgi:hypothetical protein